MTDIYEVRREEAKELSRKLAREGIYMSPWRIMQETYFLDDRIPHKDRERSTVDSPKGPGPS